MVLAISNSINQKLILKYKFPAFVSDLSPTNFLLFDGVVNIKLQEPKDYFEK